MLVGRVVTGVACGATTVRGRVRVRVRARARG